MHRPALIAFAAVVAAAVTFAPSGSSSGRHELDTCYVNSTGVVTDTTTSGTDSPAPRFFSQSYIPPGSGTCGTYDWQVSPSYVGDYYSDTTSADAAEPPAPSPTTPPLPTWRDLYDWPNGHGYAGWHTNVSSQTGAYGMQSSLGGYYGLWLWPVGGSSYSYSQGQYAEWTFTAPGTTRISTATLTLSYKNKLLAHHCIDIGFRAGNGAIVYHNEHCTPVQPPDSQRSVTISLADPNGNPTTKVLYFRIRVDCGGASTCSKNIPALDPLQTGGYARLTKVDMTLVDDDVPVVMPSGSLYQLGSDYTNGTGSPDLTLFANDPGSGVQRGWTDISNGTTVATANAGCDPTHKTPSLDNRICPQTFEYTTQIALSNYPEGAIAFGERANDLAGTIGTSDDWTVYIDRTPPTAPSQIAEQAFEAGSGTVLVGWTDGVDPDLPDGNPGSGVGSYDFRYQVNGGTWSDWQNADGGAQVPAQLGQTVNMEVRSIDDVGNYSGSATGSFSVVSMAGSINPNEDATDDTDQTRSLTSAQSTQATQLAQSDSRITQLLGGRATTVGNITPWTTAAGSLIGATLSLSWSGPLTLTTDWPAVSFHPSDDGYGIVNYNYSASNVTQLSVMVDLSQGAVVAYEPDGDGVVTSDETSSDSNLASTSEAAAAGTIQPQSTSSSGTTTTYSTTSGSVASTTSPPSTPQKEVIPPGSCNLEGGRNVWLLSNKNVAGIGLDRWWNWDFQKSCRPSLPLTHLKAKYAVDMPVTLVFYGNVDTPTAKDIWNRGVGQPLLLGSKMFGRVWDRADPNTPTSHLAHEPRSAVWDSDKGTYLGRPSTHITIPSPIGTVVVCTEHRKWHYRAYAPASKSGGDDRLYNPAWGYYVIATTHIDYKESLEGDCPGHWSGDSEASELRVAATAPSHTHEVHFFTGVSYTCTYPPDPWVVQDANTGVRSPNTLQLHNYDMRGRVGSHVYISDGKATMIHVDQLSHPFNDCDPHGG